MLVASIVGLLALVTSVYGTVMVYTKAAPHLLKEEFRDMPAEFGADIPLEGLSGQLVLAQPADACAPLAAPPAALNYTGNWIALIAKAEECTFERQVRNAQAAGYICAIVHNVNSSELEVMTAADAVDIEIAAVFVSDLAGLLLAEKFLYNMSQGYYLVVNSELPFNINTHLLLPFAVVVAACLVVILIFMIVKCIKDRRRARRQRLPARSLAKILTWQFTKGDPYDTCAICLEDYSGGERLRVLPCAHAYHAACVDPWLTRARRVCPVCKRRVFVAGELAGSDSSESDVSDPLLRAAPYPQSGTFDEQNENPFARATRFVARLRARQRARMRARDTEVAVSSSEEERPASDDENGNTADRTPLVPAETPRARRPRRAPTAAPGDHSINDSAQGEIGVAALPVSPAHVSL